MRKRARIILVALVVGLLLAATWMPGTADASLLRLAALFNGFTGEFTTGITSVAGGIPIFITSVFAPYPGTLYVNMYSNADQHSGAGQDFTCLIDGVFCNPGGGAAGGAPPGWIRMQKTPAGTGGTNCGDGGGGDGDCHDNSVTYMWCRNVSFGLHSVVVRMGVSAPAAVGKVVFVEKSHYTVDISSPFAGSPASCGVGAPAPATTTPHTISVR